MAKKKVFQIGNALAEGLEETITAGNNYSGELRVEIIPLRKIEPDPNNARELLVTFEDVHNGISDTDPLAVRKSSEIEDLRSLAQSIQEQGIINPIVVYKWGEKYRLVAGERRTLSSILIGKTEIQAKILESKPNELKISLLQWMENIERTDLSLWERLRNLERIVKAYAGKKGVSFNEVTITELSNLINCTKSHALNYKIILLADSELKDLIRENKIKNLEKAALIANIEMPEIKQYAIQACIAGAPLKKLKFISEQAKVKPQTIKQITRGRQAISVNFGTTKNIEVAKFILDSILQNDSIKPLSNHFTNINWRDFQSLSNTFRQLVQKLEELHAQ